ncbi:DMT family transporter [Saccharopolyspora mangrovi]|uniref:DMT family transporter n=1 Tax=Saccharopolyspora mangrovi TaxID=3082379 RepID=UPI00389AFAD9
MRAVLPIAFVVFWSSGFVGAGMAADTGASANTSLFWRYAVTAAVLLAIAVARRRRYGRAFLAREIVLGVLGQAVYLSGVFHGASLGVPAGTSALIASLQPVLVAVISSRLAHESLGARRAFGLAAGIAGVGLVVVADIGAGGGALGVLAVLTGMAGLTAATLLGDRRPRPGGHDLLDSLTVQSAAALAAFALVATAGGGLTPPSSPQFWTAIVFLVVFPFVGGYGCYLLVLDRSGSVAVSALLFLTPAVAAAWSAIALDQPLHLTTIPGFVLALIGVLALRTPAAPSSGAEARTKAPGPAGDMSGCSGHDEAPVSCSTGRPPRVVAARADGAVPRAGRAPGFGAGARHRGAPDQRAARLPAPQPPGPRRSGRRGARGEPPAPGGEDRCRS